MTTTYTTTAAAQLAGVTTDTIRVWARMGAVKATKIARRWAIEAASLAKRIAMGIRRTTKKAIVYTTENMIAISGSRCRKAGHDREYFNNWHDLAGLELSHYGTGNISSASYQGEGIPNSQGYKLLGSIDKLYFDANTGNIHCRYGPSESRVATQREVFESAVEGIRARIAAL